MRLPIRSLSSVLAFATVATVSTAHAQVVASTFGPGDSYRASAWSLFDNGASFQRIAQSFVYTGPSGFELAEMRFAFRQGAGYGVSFRVGEDIGTSTPLVGFSGMSQPAAGILSLFVPSGVALTTGSTYWLWVGAESGGWNQSNQGATGLSFEANDQDWSAQPFASAAYEISVRPVITADVPEPSTVALLLVGLAGMASGRRRQHLVNT